MLNRTLAHPNATFYPQCTAAPTPASGRTSLPTYAERLPFPNSHRNASTRTPMSTSQHAETETRERNSAAIPASGRSSLRPGILINYSPPEPRHPWLRLRLVPRLRLRPFGVPTASLSPWRLRLRASLNGMPAEPGTRVPATATCSGRGLIGSCGRPLCRHSDSLVARSLRRLAAKKPTARRNPT